MFDDQAATSITLGAAPFTGSFKPEGLLSTLNGIPANGTWTLEITDDANADIGTLNSWSLTITNPAGSYQCSSCSLAAPGEATNLLFTSKNAVTWSSASGASNYYLYRGGSADLPNLLNGSVDSCQRASTPALSMGESAIRPPASSGISSAAGTPAATARPAWQRPGRGPKIREVRAPDPVGSTRIR